MSESTQDRIDDAIARGLHVVYSNEYVLQLDIDTPEEAAQFRRMKPFIRNLFGIVSEIEVPSPSGKGTHAYLKMDKSMTIPQRIAIQACLGSDPYREALSLEGFMAGKERPVLLFETEAATKEWNDACIPAKQAADD